MKSESDIDGTRTRFAMNGNGFAMLKLASLVVGLGLLSVWAFDVHSQRHAGGWNGYLLAGFAIAGLSVVVYAMRFRRVLRVVGVELTLLATLRMQMLAMFYHFFVPLSAGADLTRFAKLRALAPERGPAVFAGAIVLDHFVGLATLLVISAALAWLLKPLALELDDGLVLVLFVAAMVTAGLLVVRSQRGRALDWRELGTRLATGRGDLVRAFACAGVMQLLLAAAVYTGGQALGVDMAYLDILFVLTASLIFQAVPVHVGGVGLADVAGTGLYVALGFTLPAAILLVSVMYFYRIGLAIAGGVWELSAERGRGTVSRREKSGAARAMPPA